jgi:SOS-response transcriptional repressor LexA
MAIDEKELQKILKILNDAGWQPQVCDTPIPVYESVHAGNPTEPGNVPPEMTMVPKAFLSMYPDLMIRVVGNSMIDRGIEDGDWVKVSYGRIPRQGDIVVVAIDSECTVKCYYEADDGSRWLVSQNRAEKSKYKAIRLDDSHSNVHLCGVVTDLRKSLPRVPEKDMKWCVDEAMEEYAEEPRISDERIERVIRMLGGEIKIARMWYAVCRGLVDADAAEEDDFDTICEKIRRILPHHQHLPKASEMQTMAVESFSKPVCKWVEGRAPVRGKRFRNYRALGEKSITLLTMSEADFAKL